SAEPFRESSTPQAGQQAGRWPETFSRFSCWDYTNSLDESEGDFDPIAQLAALGQTPEQIHQRVQDITPIDDADLQALWKAQAQKLLDPSPPPHIKERTDQFLVLVTCRDEKEQTELLARLQAAGRECKALLA